MNPNRSLHIPGSGGTALYPPLGGAPGGGGGADPPGGGGGGADSAGGGGAAPMPGAPEAPSIPGGGDC